MSEQSFVIPGRLPGYNELNKSGWGNNYRVKTKALELVEWYIKVAPFGITPVSEKITVEIRCFEPNARRDDDNVTSGASKIILDALQQMGIIKGDGQRYVQCIKHPVEVDRENPRIEVTLRTLV